MTEKELYELLSQLQIGVYYDHFVGTPCQPNVELPFILYRVDSTNTLKADDKVHYQDNNYIVDLVTEVKDVELESQLEELFTDNYIPYDKEEDYLSDERIYQIRYFI